MKTNLKNREDGVEWIHLDQIRIKTCGRLLF
jgi:hypothetical protein